MAVRIAFLTSAQIPAKDRGGGSGSPFDSVTALKLKVKTWWGIVQR